MKITKVDKDKSVASFKQNISNTNVDIQADKFFYNRNKTIGFRKDKKLFKFVGLRDGYSKQLELTVKSVIIDGVEKIASNRVNFNEISLSGDTVIHNINGIDFFNKIDLSNYKNLIKIEENFTNLDIIYEVHLKGIKLKDKGYYSNGKLIYMQNHIGQFTFVDDGNDNVIFNIEYPIAFDKNDKIYNSILTHELYKEGDKYYYKKTIIENNIEELPLYIDVNILFNTSTYSNILDYSYNDDADTSWINAIGGGGVLSLNTNDYSLNKFDQKNIDFGWWQPGTSWNNSWITFDRSSPSEPTYVTHAVSDPSYASAAWSNDFDVTPGDTITIELPYYTAIASPLEFYPTISIVEYGGGVTTTNFSITGSSHYEWDHTLTAGTTSAQLYIKCDAGNSNSTEFNSRFLVHKPGIPSATYYDSYIERQFLYFDTSQLYQIAINKMELKFDTETANGEYVIQKVNTLDDNIISTSDFNSYYGTPYTSFIPNSYHTHILDLGQTIIDDFVDQSVTKLVIREKKYDYNSVTPLPAYTNYYTHNWSYQLDVEVGKFIVTGKTQLDFQLENTGFGVMYSQGATYYDAWSGTSSPTVIHSSTSGTYNNSATYGYDLSNYGLYRTFLNFDTSILTIYDRYIIKSAKLIIKNYNNNEDISIFKGTQDPLSELSSGSTTWVSFDDHYIDVEGIILDSSMIVNLEPEIVSISGNTMFVIRNKVYDYEQNFSVGVLLSSFGVDFDATYFQIELEPYLISGLDYISAEKGKEVTLHASRNTEEGEIYWATDSGITNTISSGNSLTINTINYNDGDIIYAAILDVSGNTISYNVLNVYLNLYTLVFNGLPERNFNVHDVDIDAVYFKYHQCLSGVTYAYVRELDDVYEQNLEVSDGEGLGAYNMYNEFDIIDEFFSNSHEVEVVGNLDEMDLNLSYKEIDGVYIHEGTRVLLHSTVPTSRDGVYVADYNLKLTKTDELDDADAAFRYKAHVGAGDYLDYEFHTEYYVLSGTTTEGEWNSFDYYDSQIYGITVIDMEEYGISLFDPNIV